MHQLILEERKQFAFWASDIFWDTQMSPNPSASLISCLVIALIRLPKSKEDLSKLMHWPDALPYFLTTFITFSHSRGSALQKKRLSSAKRRWDTDGHVRVTRIPVIFPWFFAWLRRQTNVSVNRIKMKGDKGSPWRRPLPGIIFPLGCPFMSTLYCTYVIHLIIQVIQIFEKPILRMTASINDHSILSYALLMSVLMAILLLHPLGLVLRAWKFFWAIMILSEICLPNNKGWLGFRYQTLWHFL